MISVKDFKQQVAKFSDVAVGGFFYSPNGIFVKVDSGTAFNFINDTILYHFDGDLVFPAAVSDIVFDDKDE